MSRVLPIYALSHECAIALVLTDAVLFCGFTVKVSAATVNASEVCNSFFLGDFLAHFNLNWINESIVRTSIKLSNFTAKKNCRTLWFTAKFCSVNSILLCIRKYSALESILLTDFDWSSCIILEHFTFKCICYPHQNFLFSLGGTLLNGGLGYFFRAKNIWILVRCSGNLVCEGTFGENLLVVF